MADRRTRQQDSPRRRKREATKAAIDQDEVPRTRASYQPEELASSYSSSSSYIDISRTYPSNRLRGFGAIRAFFTAPSEHRRQVRRRTSRPYLRGGTPSSSSINTDLAYGSGYIRRRKSDRRRKKGKEREISGRRDPRADRDPDAAILEVGAGLAAIARTQNKLDQADARKQGIQPPRRSDSSFLKQPESNRGLGSSKVSHDVDEDGWESATDADSEASSVDLRLAYGHDRGPGWSFFRSRPRRKESVVDPSLFGPANSLHGVVQEPVGFDDVDYDNLSDYPPPTVATLQRQQSYPLPTTITALQGEQKYPPVGESPRVQGIISDNTSATGPMQYVYPVPTSDPTRFDAERGSVISPQEQYGSRPAPVPIQQPPIQIQQPQPKPIVAQSVFEQPYSTRSEPKVSSSSARSKSSVAGAALAGVAGGVLASAMGSDRRDERGDKSVRRDGRDAYDDDRRVEPRKDDSRKLPDVKDADSSRRERRRDRDREGAEETREERRERRRREKRDDPEYERREERSEKRREETLPDGGSDRRREDRNTERADDKDDSRRTPKDAPIVTPVDPFQYQVADDAFKTPDGTRNSEPFTNIQRARSPAVVTVERVPHWHRDASSKEVTKVPVRNVEDEKDLEARESKRTEQEAESLYKEIENSTISADPIAVSVAVVAEENRRGREVRKRRYDRSNDTSPNGERDPIQEEADRIYREAVLARKLAESNNDDPVVRIVTPPEMAHKKDKEILYPVPNADFQLDHVMDPLEFMASPIKGQGEGFDRIKSISGVASQDLNRPLLTLVRPTPTPSPAPREQVSRSKRKESSRGVEPSESKTSESDRKRSSRDDDQPESTYRDSERRDYSRDREPSGGQKTPAVDTVITGSKGDTTQTPTSANGTKSVTWGQNDTREINVESPYEVKDDPISNMGTVSDAKDKPKMSKEKKASAWGALRGAFISGAAADIVAKATEAPKEGERGSERGESNVKLDEREDDKRHERKESSRSEPFEYRGVIVEPEHPDNEVRERGPPAVGPKPAKITRSNMPGAFDDDLDFTATVAAGLQDSGFDPDIVIKDPKYRRRSSPPGSEGPPLAEYKQAYAETVSDVSQYGVSTKESPRDTRTRENNDYANYAAETEQKKVDKPAKGRIGETRDLDISGETPGTGQLVEEPESMLESLKSNKKDKKRDKSRKSKDSYDEINDRSSKKVSVPVDAFDDLRAEVQADPPEDWNSGKKSKKSKRDSDPYDSPSRSISASDMTTSVEKSKKSKDRSSKRSSQYDSEPNPEDIPLPSASEISRDDDYGSRKSKGSSKKGSSTSDAADRESRSVKSDSSRYADEDDSRSSKKEKRNSGFFSGIFGSSTSKSDPEPEQPREVEESESKKKKKTKRNSTESGSEIYDAGTKSDTKVSQNGNGYNSYDVDDGDPKRSMNGDSKRGKTAEKEESFLDKAGPLGAGAGFAAAIALAAQHQQSKAAKTDMEDLGPQSHTPENTSLAKASAAEVPREVVEENIVDPDIVQRIPRPSIDPQYGDFLPLPPSNPGSPNVEPEDTLPSLPETPPGTPPRIENVPARDRSVGSSRRNELPALVKTPSHSAIPIKYIMGNRSTPSSPGMVRAPVIASPSTMSPDTLNLHRARPRPTSWDSTKEIQPLYLLDPSRRAPASQSTDSELQSPIAEDAVISSHISSLILAPEEITSSDVRSPPKDLQIVNSDTGLRRDNDPGDSDLAKFADFTTLPPLPTSPISEPEEQGFSSLPLLQRSGASMLTDTTDLARLPRLPDSPSSTPVDKRLRDSSDLGAANVLTGTAIGLSAAVIALASVPEKSLHDEESPSKVKSAEDLPEEFQVEPITKDRSSYLFQATPPAKRANDFDARSGNEAEYHGAEVLPRSMEEILTADNALGDSQDSPIRARSVERNSALQALTTSVSEEKEQLATASPTRPIQTDEVEPDDADEILFTKPKKSKKKDNSRNLGQIGLEDNFSSGNATPTSIIDTGRDSSATSDSPLKRLKKEKKKDKKRGISQTEAEDFLPNRTATASTIELAPGEGGLRETSSQPISLETRSLAEERTLDNLSNLEELSDKEPRHINQDQGKSSKVSELGSEIPSTTILSLPIAPMINEAQSVNESTHALSLDVLPASTEPSRNIGMQEESLIKDDKTAAPDFADTKDHVSSSAAYLPSFVPGLEEADTRVKRPEIFSESLLPSSVQPTDDIDATEESSLKKSKKSKKRDKKGVPEDPEVTAEASPISILPSSVASAIQDTNPSDGDSLKTSKKDKKREKKNRKSLSRSSTIVEPVVGEHTQDLDEPIQGLDEATRSLEEHAQTTKDTLEAVKGPTRAVYEPPEVPEEHLKALDEPLQTTNEDAEVVKQTARAMDSIGEELAKAEQTPLPISRTISEADGESQLGDLDASARNIISSQEESRQSSETASETISTKEPESVETMGRDALTSLNLNKPSQLAIVEKEPISVPNEREADVSQFKNGTSVQTKSHVQPQAEISILKKSGAKESAGESKHSGETAELSMSEQASPEYVSASQLKQEFPGNELSLDEPARSDAIQKEVIESTPESTLFENPVEKERIQKVPTGENSITDEPIEGACDLSVEDSGAIAAVEDPTQSKITEPDSESSNAKDLRKSKKKKAKYKQGVQDEESSELKPLVEPTSEPTTAAASEREDMSGFSTPTSKGKGKKKQKRKPIAWDLPEAEAEPELETAKSILTTSDTPQDTDASKEVSALTQLDPPELNLKHSRIGDELDRVQVPGVTEEESGDGPDVGTTEIQGSLPHANSSTFSTTPTESKVSNTTQVEFPITEYFPSATNLRSPKAHNEAGKPVDTGYFPSAVRILPAAAVILGIAASSKAQDKDKDLGERSYSQDASLPPEIAHEQIGTPGGDVHHENIHVHEPSNDTREAFSTDAEPPSPVATDTLLEHVSTRDNSVGVMLNKANIGYFPSAALLHSPSLAGPSGDLGGKGYFPSATALLPSTKPAAQLTQKREPEQLALAEHSQDLKEQPLLGNLGLGEQPLSAAGDGSLETPVLVSENDVFDFNLPEGKDVEGSDNEPPNTDSKEPAGADREWNTESGLGKKNSKKNKKSRAGLSRSSTQTDEISTKVVDKSEEGYEEIESAREAQPPEENRPADGLEAGFKEDQVLLVKQLQAEFGSGARKSKKGKNSRSTSRTPSNYGSGSPLPEEPQVMNDPQGTDTQLSTEVSREIIPDEEEAPKSQGPDGLAAGFTIEQLEAARQMSKEYASGSSKSKKNRKSKGLIRTATDESMSGFAGDDGSAEASLATTEVDSATDSPLPLSTVPTPDTFESSPAAKTGKKGKKRQSLLRSFTQDNEDSAGPSRGIVAEQESTQLDLSGKEPSEMPQTSESIPDLGDTSAATVEEPESTSFTTKKGKRGSKKRQILVQTPTQEEEPSFDPMSGVAEQESKQRGTTGADSNQSPAVIADDISILGAELNYSLKKSKKVKKGKKENDVDEEIADTNDIPQAPGQASLQEQDIKSKIDPDQGSLADRIWAGVVPNESIQPEIKNSSAESEDPLGLYTVKKKKKNQKKGQNMSTIAPEPEITPTDGDERVADVPINEESKDLLLSRTDEAEAEADLRQPKLFDTWSFSNIPADAAVQDISKHEPETISKDIGQHYDPKREESALSDLALARDGDNLSKAVVSEQDESATSVGPVDDVETPPPVMPKILAWEDESQPQPADTNIVEKVHSSDPETKDPDKSDAKSTVAEHSVSKPVSAGILVAGAALLAGSSMKNGNEPLELEPLSKPISRSLAENGGVDSSRLMESRNKKGKRPAKLLDRRSLPKDDLFDDPILWDGAETQKYGEHTIEKDSGDESGFWSAAVGEENTRNESAVDDTEDGPSSMPHKRERSESLMHVWEPSTVLDHIKTPRKHQSEDVPAAIARDAVMEQEMANEQSIQPEDHERDIRSDENVPSDNLKSASHSSDVRDAILLSSLEEGNNKEKKDDRFEAWDTATKHTTANAELSRGESIDAGSLRDVDTHVNEHPRTSTRLEHDMDGQEIRSASSAAQPIGNDAEGQRQENLDERSVKDKHRRQEVYLPFSSTESTAVDDERVLRREVDVTPPEPKSQVLIESRAKDKHRRQESYFPPQSTLPIVIEEEYHKTEQDHVAHQRGIDDSNRDSAFVADSPMPSQRRFADDHEYTRDSGVHLRDWGDTPVSREKPHVASTDAALARLSWPTVDEKKETVDINESQRPKEERSPKVRDTDAGVAVKGAVAVAELAHLAAQSPSQKKDEHRENAKFDRSITPNMSRLQTPDQARYRPGSVDSNRSSGTPPLRRRDRKLSGDLRSLSQRSQANLAKEAKDTNDAKEAERSPATSIVNINPIANEGRPRVKDMADVYDGYGEGRIGSPMSPTRPHSMRRRQSMQVLDLEARLEQLAAENRALAEAKELAERSLQSSQKATLALADRDAEVDSLKQTLDWLHREVERLKEVNDGLTSANITLGRQHNERYSALESQHNDATRELDDLHQTHSGLSGGIEDVVLERVAAATAEKDQEIMQLRQDLEAAHERIREMQREILTAKSNDSEFLTFRDEDYFDNACQQLCQHVRQWVLRFSKFSDMRACRRTNEINNDKIIDRLDNAVLDGSDVDEYLSDRVKRRDIFMSMTMTMIWEFVFTRYLFGMDREQRQKLKSLEKTLLEVGPPAAVHQWRATTLTLLSKRDAFQQQREQDTVAVVQMIFQTLSEILPPPTHLEEQIQEQLTRVMKSAVDLSIEMRTQRAEYMMLPPLQPEYDANGDLARQVQFNAALMNERSGDTVSNEDLETQNAVVRIVLFPLVVKKGDDTGSGDDEIVVCPAQVLVAKPKRHARGLTPEGLGQNSNHSRVSMQSNMPIPDI